MFLLSDRVRFRFIIACYEFYPLQPHVMQCPPLHQMQVLPHKPASTTPSRTYRLMQFLRNSPFRFLQRTPVVRCLHVEQPYVTDDPVLPGAELSSPVIGAPNDGVASDPVAGAPTAGVLAAFAIAFPFAFAFRFALPLALLFAFAWAVAFPFAAALA